VLAPVLRAIWREVEELDATERSGSGFGSTGLR
jgi:dUTPase